VDDVEAEFRAITDATMAEEANDALAKQMAKVRVWRERYADRARREPTLRALMSQMRYDNPDVGISIIAPLAAALWKLLEDEDRGRPRT